MSKNTDKRVGEAVLLVLVTCPEDQSEGIARALLESKLAACINVIPHVKSFYRWQGKVQQDNESLMLIKCPSDNYRALEDSILEMHPYELPEIITVSIVGGLPGYLNWVLHPDKNKSE
ncbi:MAG: divalent-cation tolerance protein CutA [Gammaproteobacteria bacterium]|nr:MAG: divalent-cation tolerance protein CutA [Gammaproteobacteria bacterium]